MASRVAGDYDYESGGSGYAARRRTDPRIAAYVHAALGTARTVLNVGAGAGSYEPVDRLVAAVEPSASMRSQRPAHLTVAIDAVAEQLPFADGAFDAAMAAITVHQWKDLDRGLAELRRVARGPVVVMTLDVEALAQFWLFGYAPEVIEVERTRFPSLDLIGAGLGGSVTVTPVPVPFDCVDGIGEAFYGRPEAFLDADVRRAQSGWGFVAPRVQERAVAALAADLASGEWDRRHGHLRTQPECPSALRLVTSVP